MTNLNLKSLWVYPIKSCAGISVKELHLTSGGAKWDRHWMIVDEKGQFQSQRQLPKMALIQTELTDDSLILRIDGYVFGVPFEGRKIEKRSVTVWNNNVEAYVENPLINEQLSIYLGKKVFLVRSYDSQRQYGIHFADSRPIQLANLDSMEDFNSKLGQKITMERFRPNIVISGLGPFGEDQLDEFEIQNIKFKVSKPCIRCNIINVEPTTGERPNSEPLLKLKEHHSVEGKPAFGVLIIPQNEGRLVL